MGTNYYLHEKPPCSACGREYDPLHIGKSSAGWCFALHVIPEQGIRDLSDWKERWAKPGAVIRNEFGMVLTHEEMSCIVIFSGLRRRVVTEEINHGYDLVTGEFS